MDTVNEVVRALDGSFSAEHGIGKLKPYMMPDWRGGAELAVMRRIKAALDPLGIMNPGKVSAVDCQHATLSRERSEAISIPLRTSMEIGACPGLALGSLRSRRRNRIADQASAPYNGMDARVLGSGMSNRRDPGLAQPDRHRGSVARHPRRVRGLRADRAGRMHASRRTVRSHGGPRRHRASLLVLRTGTQAARSRSRQRRLLPAPRVPHHRRPHGAVSRGGAGAGAPGHRRARHRGGARRDHPSDRGKLHRLHRARARFRHHAGRRPRAVGRAHHRWASWAVSPR